MTKKDFELIADIIRMLPDIPTRMEVARRFASRFEQEFPAFNAVKFIMACTK